MNGAAGSRSVLRENLETSYVNHINVYGAVAPVPSALLTLWHVNYFVNFRRRKLQPIASNPLASARRRSGKPPSANYAATQRFAAAFSSSGPASSVGIHREVWIPDEDSKLLPDDGKTPFSCRLRAEQLLDI